MKFETTPLPWSYDPKSQARFDSFTGEKSETTQHWVNSNAEGFVCLMGSVKAEQDAKYIVHAVNILPELIEALEECISDALSGEGVKSYEELLSRAKNVDKVVEKKT